MRKSPPFSRFLAVIALLPAFLGGGTAQWSQGLVLLLLGLLFVIAPPRHSLGWPVNLVMAALIGWGSTAFLPANWFPASAWRGIAFEHYAFQFRSCVSPQPWLTAESVTLFIGALAWLYYLGGNQQGIDRRIAVQWLCGGVILWAALSIGLCLAGMNWPWRISTGPVFGSFPNRNHTANLLAVGAILTMACAHDDFRRGKRYWPFWFGGWLILLWGLLLTSSRAGIIMAFLGIAVWGGTVAMFRPSKSRLGGGAGFFLVLLGAFLLGGGTTLDRFLPKDAGTESIASHLRWSIQKDALDLAQSAPWTGVGLGNFDSVFWVSPHRALGSANYHVLHPESDWIWLAAEAGWPSVALALCGCAVFARRILPLGGDPDWRLRAAAGAAVLVFALHGLVDVPAHRYGSALPALFTGALALQSRRDACAPRWLPALFRVVGSLLTLIGGLWLAAGPMGTRIPGTTSILEADRQAALFNSRAEYQKASRIATAAIHWAPLHWRLYYHRAVSTALGKSDIQSALADFRKARFLNPGSPDLPFEEGFVWLNTHPALALSAWQEALQRAGPGRAVVFRRLLESSLPADLKEALISLADRDSQLLLVIVLQAPPTAFHEALNRLLAADPHLATLSEQELGDLFRVWRSKGAPAEFTAQMECYEPWMRIGWFFVAEINAAKGDYRRAYEQAEHYIQPPQLPSPPLFAPISELRHALYLHPNDFATAYALYLADVREGETDQALTTLQRLTKRPDCPAYFYYLEAGLLARTEQWQQAWESILRTGFKHP